MDAFDMFLRELQKCIDDKCCFLLSYEDDHSEWTIPFRPVYQIYDMDGLQIINENDLRFRIKNPDDFAITLHLDHNCPQFTLKNRKNNITYGFCF